MQLFSSTTICPFRKDLIESNIISQRLFVLKCLWFPQRLSFFLSTLTWTTKFLLRRVAALQLQKKPTYRSKMSVFEKSSSTCLWPTFVTLGKLLAEPEPHNKTHNLLQGCYNSPVVDISTHSHTACFQYMLQYLSGVGHMVLCLCESWILVGTNKADKQERVRTYADH